MAASIGSKRPFQTESLEETSTKAQRLETKDIEDIDEGKSTYYIS